jgi:hypothetical protein
MGPTDGVFDGLPDAPGVDHAPDHAARAQAFAKRHPHVSIASGPSGWTATWLEACGGPYDGETVIQSRELLGHLMDYLEARFGPEPGPR